MIKNKRWQFKVESLPVKDTIIDEDVLTYIVAVNSLNKDVIFRLSFFAAMVEQGAWQDN